MTARITGRYRVEEIVGKGRGGRPCVALLEPLEYRVGEEEGAVSITVPIGFDTDFASVPWGLWNFFPPLGPWARPAIIHDFLYRTQGSCIWEGSGWLAGRSEPFSRAEADAIFREAMEVVGVPAWRRAIMYRAVRLGGGRGWGS